jgi:hypothetical protein
MAVEERRVRGHGVIGLEWVVAQVIGDWTPSRRSNGVVCRRARRQVMHGNGFRCATVTEMLHGRRLCMKRTGELGRKRGQY